MPHLSNSEHLDPGFDEFQLEFGLEKRHEVLKRRGKLLLSVFDSRERMGLLDDAVRFAQTTRGPVDIVAIRRYRDRHGTHFSLEQQFATDVSLFLRTGKPAGNVEAGQFSDAGETLSTRLLSKGSHRGRGNDTVGLFAMINAISAARDRFLLADGLGILVGNDRLSRSWAGANCRNVLSRRCFKTSHFALEHQWVRHPAYNFDR